MLALKSKHVFSASHLMAHAYCCSISLVRVCVRVEAISNGVRLSHIKARDKILNSEPNQNQKLWLWTFRRESCPLFFFTFNKDLTRLVNRAAECINNYRIKQQFQQVVKEQHTHKEPTRQLNSICGRCWEMAIKLGVGPRPWAAAGPATRAENSYEKYSKKCIQIICPLLFNCRSLWVIYQFSVR